MATPGLPVQARHGQKPNLPAIPSPTVLIPSPAAAAQEVHRLGTSAAPNNGQIKFNGISSEASTESTIRVKYENGDSNQRYATVEVNGRSQILAFVPSTDGNTPFSSSLNADLEEGSGNTIVISGYNGGWG